MTLAELAFAVSDDTPDAQRRGQKSDTAYRTISEVAADLNLPQHVLRFWESKFKQISPLKRGGGRRYYRPQDIDLIRRIHYLLHIQGYTIKGVQKLLAKDRNLQQSVPMLLEGDSARVVVANALQRVSTSDDAAPQQDFFPAEPTVNVTRQTDLKLLLDKLKLLRTQLNDKDDAEAQAVRC